MNGASGSKVDDRLFGAAVKMAQVQFFAWADHNQMPLRRIMVDWREKGVDKPDNTISGTSQGYYTNYKPYCGDSSGKAKECVFEKTNTIIDMAGFKSFCTDDSDCVYLGNYKCVNGGCYFQKTIKELSGAGITCQNDKECPTSHPDCVYNYPIKLDSMLRYIYQSLSIQKYEQYQTPTFSRI
ncbi:MAG: hypothetical protein HY980_01185 [Candidatus Magasanikbacteria bacterium]|nr:hypothetical protein [Candidatus Magasanikbacteria bacterium]